MKLFPTLLFATISCSCFAMDITTRDGTIYKRSEVVKVDPDGIIVRHFDGVAKIQFEELPTQLQNLYHCDATKVASYRKSIEDEKMVFAAKIAAQQKQTALNSALALQEEQRRLQATLALSQKQAEDKEELRKTERALKGFTISPSKKSGLRLEHESYEKLLSVAKTKAANMNYNQNLTDSLISSVPAGGNLILHIERSTIEAANTQYFTVIVFDRSGKEVLRRVGDDHIAELPDSNGMWWNIMLLSLPQIYETPIKIRVVDNLKNTATEFDAE